MPRTEAETAALLIGQQEANALQKRLEVQVKGHDCSVCDRPLWVAWKGEAHAAGGFDGTWKVRCLCYPAEPVWRRQESFLAKRRRDMAQQHAIVVWEPQTLLTRLKEAEAAKIFPSDEKFNTEMRLVFAQVAVLYRLDPLMREIMPYQGQIYITLDGRRKLDNRAGRKASFRFEPLTKEELRAYVDTAGWDEKDVPARCIATELDGRVAVREGRVKASEQQRNTHLPTAQWKWEMACGRAERFCRRILWGSVETPAAWGHGIAVGVIDGEPGVELEPPAAITPPENPAAPLYARHARPEEARSAPAAQAPAPTTTQPSAAPQVQRRPAPAGFCEGHRANMFRSSRTKKVGHVLENGTPCEGIPAAPPLPWGEGQGEGELDDGAPLQDESADLPPSQAEDLQALQATVAAKGMEWGYFVQNILRCESWEEWVSLAGTVAGAREWGRL